MYNSYEKLNNLIILYLQWLLIKFHKKLLWPILSYSYKIIAYKNTKKNKYFFVDIKLLSCSLFIKIYTEFCPNGSVEELIDDLNKPLTITQAHYVLRDVLFGLEFLNEKRRILHRDLKSANLLIGQDMSIKIANFDVSAKNLNARSPKLTNINDKRYLYVKSPHYIAPEILKCDQYAMNNFKSDIWSFGIVCIELLEMLPPNSHLHPEAIIDQAKIPNWRGPNLPNLHSWPSEFSDLVTKCLNVKYDDRPSASELQKVVTFLLSLFIEKKIKPI